MAAEYAIEMRGITKTFGSVVANRDVELNVRQGEILALLGENGSGKTTLTKLLLRLTVHVQGGRVLVDGQDVSRCTQQSLRRQVAYVPQAKQTSLFCTVEEMVLLGRSSRIGAFSAPSKEDFRQARAAIERLGLSHLSVRRCCELSGGEVQMVLIARALASQPGVLVLDEPESNLDFKNQLLVLDTIEDLARSGLTCIFNTHFRAAKGKSGLDAWPRRQKRLRENLRCCDRRQNFGIFRCARRHRRNADALRNLSGCDPRVHRVRGIEGGRKWRTSERAF
mgnify:CR=1 FL=1